MHNLSKKIWLPVLFMTVLMAGSAWAKVFNLCTGQADMAMPDGAQVPVWGFGIDTGADPCNITVPGPELVVPPTDPVLRIKLRNTLSEPVSLHIIGQTLTNNAGPVYDRITRQYGRRVRSFTQETPPGVTRSYNWDSFKPGTYMLQSGTNPAKQVQMGLYAPVRKNATATEAYTGITYDRELTLVFHEIDPEIHLAVAENRYGLNPTGPLPHITSSVHHTPRYFLINGKGYPDPALDPILQAVQGDRVLLRLINAGLKTHVPQVLGPYMTLVAEDGTAYPYPKEQHGIELPPAKTVDAILQPAAGKIPIYDARLRLTNAGTGPGGMLAYLAVDAPPPPDTVAVTRAAFTIGTPNILRVHATSDAPAGSVTMTAEAISQAETVALGTLNYSALNGDYRATFTGVAQPDSVRVTSSRGGSGTLNVTAR